jgi:glutathione synthase/RimK-type ligase-like ATP-grasp enzyme
MTILFYGWPDDSPLAHAMAEADAVGVDHRVIDQARLADCDLSITLDEDGLDGWVDIAGDRLPLATFSAVYARPLELTGRNERARRLHQGFIEWLDIADALVVNRPAAMLSNSSKPYQAQLIVAAGFEVPVTLVTSDPEEVVAFRREHGRVIYKSISGIRSIVRELDDAALRDLERIRDLPTQFQAHVPGVDVRVHAVGRTCFATQIVSDSLDYRYARRDGAEAELRPVELSDDETERCVALAERLGLTLCGIDLRRRPDGTLVCFEVNPMPAYSYFEAEAGQPIGKALVDVLASADSRVPEYAALTHGADR